MPAYKSIAVICQYYLTRPIVIEISQIFQNYNQVI